MDTIKIINLWIEKAGNNPSDYEDSVSFNLLKCNRGMSLYGAIADGATESSFAQEWAKMITRAFSKGSINTVDELNSQVEILAERWRKVITRKPLPWYAEEKVSRGAFATFCGLILKNDETENCQSGKYSTLAIGDSCLFVVRNDQLIRSFPIDDSSAFGNTPWLLSSTMNNNKNLWDNVLMCDGSWQKEDMFFLMTDAVAHWFLTEHETGNRPWEILIQLAQQNNRQPFVDWVTEMRNAKKMKNDDTTILIINV